MFADELQFADGSVKVSQAFTLQLFSNRFTYVQIHDDDEEQNESQNGMLNRNVL